MAEAIATPRISSAYIDAFAGQTVRITGKVTQLSREQATIDADGPVTLVLNRDSQLVQGNGVEVVGKVQSDTSIKVLQATDLGADINYAAISAVVDATHRYKEIFYGDSAH